MGCTWGTTGLKQIFLPSFFASGISALVIFCVTTLGLLYADKWGRRGSVIYGGVGLGVVMFLIGGLYAGNAVHGTTGAGRWVVIVALYIFAVIYSMTWAVSITSMCPRFTRVAPAPRQPPWAIPQIGSPTFWWLSRHLSYWPRALLGLISCSVAAPSLPLLYVRLSCMKLKAGPWTKSRRRSSTRLRDERALINFWDDPSN